MRARRFDLSLPAAAALLFASLADVAPAGANDAAARAQISAALEQWRLDFNARRAENICALFAPELRYDFQGLPEQNYEQLCMRLRAALADETKTFQYDLNIKEIIVSGSLAVVRLTWTSTLTAADGKVITKEDEPGLDVFRQQDDGSWKIIRYIAYPEERDGRD